MYIFISLFLHPGNSLHLPPYPHLTCADLFSIFFVIVLISQPYKTVGKIIDLTTLGRVWSCGLDCKWSFVF